MNTIEEELRAAFERQEAVVPEAASVRDRIDFAWVRVKRRRAKRRALGAAAAVLLAGAAIPVVSTNWWHGGQPVSTSAAVGTVSPAPVLTGSIDVLLIGTDRRDRAKAERLNTVMLLHVPADRSAIWMISVPKDGLVDIPGNGRQNLADAMTIGGPQLTSKTVLKLTGLEPTAAVVVDVAAMSVITDAVGGVHMCLDQAIPAQGGRSGLTVGCHEIDGDEAASVLLGREGLRMLALDRDRNNQLFLQALAAKVKAAGAGPALLGKLIQASGEGVRYEGDFAGSLRAVAEMEKPRLIGVSEPRFRVINDSEVVDSAEWKSLYKAIRDDQMEKWAAANPSYVDR